MTNQEILSLIFTIIGALAIGALLSFLFYSYIEGQIGRVRKGDKDLEVVKSIIDKNDPVIIKKRKRRGLAKTIVSYSLLTLLIPAFGFMIYGRATNGVSKFGDTTVLVVSSGSMSQKNAQNNYLVTYNLNNQIDKYDIVSFLELSNHNVVEQFDVVAYRSNDNRIIIHRVIDQVEVDGEIRYITRGDANTVSDSYMPRARDILGTYTNKSVPFFGIFILFFQSYTGIITVALIAYILIFISLQYDRYKKAFVVRENLLASQIDFNNVTYEDVEINYHSEIVIKDKKYQIVENTSKEDI